MIPMFKLIQVHYAKSIIRLENLVEKRRNRSQNAWLSVKEEVQVVRKVSVTTKSSINLTENRSERRRKVCSCIEKWKRFLEVDQNNKR